MLRYLIAMTVAGSLLCLLALGGLSAKTGGAPIVAGALRVASWSALAMGVSTAVGLVAGALV